ncbi:MULTISPECIES: HlyD family type I secretion periplasmic adaptor subunit [Providencia]|uniref:HlyD family type I secretion periplasmic adaptor subunit n=1 Tax=Providencia TaxID=586 RepID=UPI00236140C4|nr:HlyD family type I secretion periplasmic adaptor subunit [Providencia rettgeri]
MKQRLEKIRYNSFLPSHLAILKTPPSYLASCVAILISLGIFIAIIWSFFGKLDIQATTQGKLIVSGRTQQIQAFELSRLQHIHVADGQKVKQGDPLFTVNVLGVDQDIHSLHYQRNFQLIETLINQALLSQQSVTQSPLFNTLSEEEQTSAIASYQTQKIEFDSLINEISNEIQLNTVNQQARKNELKTINSLILNIKKRLEAHQSLSQKQIISQKEFLEQERELLIAEKEKTTKRSELSILDSQHHALVKKRDRIKAQKNQEWDEKYKQAAFKQVSLDQELLKNQERNQLEIIRAPVDGTVQQLTTYTIGAVLQPAQQLMAIVPNNDVQLAEIKILNKDIGFIHEGLKAEVKIDAFPYTRYGTVDGEILSISRDSTQDENLGLVYLGQIGLHQKSLLVEGEKIELTPGLSIVAEIKTDKRRVIDYLLSPINEYTSNAMREK